jgi:hypothetical protein
LCSDPCQWVPREIGFDHELQATVTRFDPEVIEQETEPFAGQGIIILRSDGMNGGVIIGSGREVGAQQEVIPRLQQCRQSRQDFPGSKVGEDAEASQQSLCAGRGETCQMPGQIIRRGEIAEQSMASVGTKLLSCVGAGQQCERCADVDRDERDAVARIGQSFDEPTFLVGAPATQRDDLDVAGSQFLREIVEGAEVSVLAIVVAKGWRMGFVQAQPGPRLPTRLIMELRADPPDAERLDQFRLEAVRELARMNADGNKRLGHNHITDRAITWRDPCL